MRFCILSFLFVVCFINQTFALDLGRTLELSIYNNNLALVKDSRKISLQVGNNDVAFEGVSTQIKPESVMILGKNIKVLEQNYDYNLIDAHNIIKYAVGSEVKTVMDNPKTGESVFNRAKILSANGATPILEFDYGIETDFNGRLVFEKLPENLCDKPTLKAKIYSPQVAIQDLLLAYLTQGISWKTNYVAYIKDNEHLDLTAWVTIINNSGVDYDNAKIQLIAGDVNQVREAVARSYGPVRTMSMAMNAVDMVADDSVVPEQISSYQLYTLPNKSDIKNSQTKQMSLFEKNDVKYIKEGRILSPLYYNNDYKAKFDNIHPQQYYIMQNSKEEGLDLALPSGVFRFYENDNKQNMQFIGENSIKHTAKGEKIELMLGQMFNVFVNGKIVTINEVSKDMDMVKINSCYRADVTKDYQVEVEFHNSGNENVNIVFDQRIDEKSKIIDENIKGKQKNINLYGWKITIPNNQDKKLTFVIRKTEQEKICN